MANFGFIPHTSRYTDYKFGGISGIADAPLVQDGQWDAWLPTFEPQSEATPTGEFDAMACVSFSALNCLETLFNRKYSFDKNYSDRFLAKMSGTTPNGNDFSTVADTIQSAGDVPETEWPYPPDASWQTYYADIPENVKTDALALPAQWNIQYEYLPDHLPATLKDALRYGPLQVAIYAYGSEVNGIYQRVDAEANHGIELYGYEDGLCWKVFDHYLQATKRLAWDYRFDAALRYSLNEKAAMPLTENCLYQLVEGLGGFALAIGDALYIDDTAKILASWAVRNGGNTAGKTGTLTQAQWDSYPHKNLKGETV